MAVAHAGQYVGAGGRRDRPALLATFATERTKGRVADGESPAAAPNGGYHLA